MNKTAIRKEFEELYYSTLTVSWKDQLEFLWDFLERTVNDQH